MPFRNGTIPPNSITWTKKMLQYLEDNWQHKTNAELAAHLGLKRTSTRMKLYEMGLKKMELESWNEEAISFIRENYKTMGDVELAEIFNKKFPRKKLWKKFHIAKKRGYLNLQRTRKEYEALRSKNSSVGGRAFTINKNSSSKNMHPIWVAGLIAWRNPELKKEILKHPELIELKRKSIILKRTIDEQRNSN